MVFPWVRRLASLLVFLGALGAVVGVVECVNATTVAPAGVKAPVKVAPSGCCSDVQVELPGVTVPDGWLLPASGPDGVSANSAGDLRIEAWNSTPLEQALSEGSLALGGLGLLVGALLLRPVLLSITAGEPFRAGNARRISLLGVTVAVTGTFWLMPPQIAGMLILQRTGLDQGGHFVSAVSIPVAPLLTAALVLAVAAAFRAGERLSRESAAMADDLAGLV